VLSLLVSRNSFACADTVVVASGDDPTLMVAGQLAAATGGPLLIIGPDPPSIAAEINRLGPREVLIVGDALPGSLPGGVNTKSMDLEGAIAEAARRLGTTEITAGVSDLTVGRAVVAAMNGSAVVTGSMNPDRDRDASWVAAHSTGLGRVWVADGTRPSLLASVMAAAGARGETILLVDPNDLRRLPGPLEVIRSGASREVVVAGGFDPTLVSWQLPALVAAPELAGGGLTFFPGRRLIALYGNPTTSALGVLGEQGPEESVRRIKEISTGYDADGVPLLPAFEIIATVASSSSGADNDYSEEIGLETLRPWIEMAAANGVYVVLDLQPGRTDFLTQARIYDEFLRLPHVGLALDPEWRLTENQVHLRQIGSVDAAEINAVSQWLSGIVREENLPQKFFLLHQFRLDMIGNRDRIETPPELATVIQMDGQGPLPTKYDTWAALMAGSEGAGWSWGWKNFYDEDTPRGGATPEQVLDLDPVPVYISFQ
jgi:hypothetical protein